jgi:hypothetical protein
VHKPAKADALHAAFDEKVFYNRFAGHVLQCRIAALPAQIQHFVVSQPR